MTDTELLQKTVDESGIPVAVLCRKSGIDQRTYYNHMNGIGEFTVLQAGAISTVLRLTVAQRNRIFFAKNVDSSATHKEMER